MIRSPYELSNAPGLVVSTLLPMDAVTTCCQDCPCQGTLKDRDVVPYRETPGCPTDEELLFRWRQESCERCLAWWVRRVFGDPRYGRLVAAIQRKFPSADVSGRVGEVVATIWQQETEITHVRGYFRKLLWRQANHDVRGGRRTKMVAVDPHDEAGPFNSLEDAPSDEQILRLADCYERLGTTARSVLDAIYWEGTPIRVIAEEKKLAYGALSRRVQRIRCELRQCIEQAA